MVLHDDVIGANSDAVKPAKQQVMARAPLNPDHSPHISKPFLALLYVKKAILNHIR